MAPAAGGRAGGGLLRMLVTVRLILVVLALACFFLAALGVPVPRGGSLIAAGLFLAALAYLIAP